MMEEVRQLVQEEGREARNLIAFHVSVETPGRIIRKPPRAGSNVRRTIPRVPAARQRSASAGRDKRSELRARYWALLFGDLQRSIGEIYNTVETHENLSECQEVILVLENYTRDFKALGEWFRLKWEYDNTPPPQRPQSLAWEIRKTDFVRPESRVAPSSSPSVSGKNSPCLSGRNTPTEKISPNFLSGKISPGSGKISPRIQGSVTSPKGNIEFFSTKINGKVTAIPEPRLVKEASRLSDIKERNSVDEIVDNNGDPNINNNVNGIDSTVELGTAKEIPNEVPKPVIIHSAKPIKMLEVSKIEEGILKAAQRKQLKSSKGTKNMRQRVSEPDLSREKHPSVQATITKLDDMENNFLNKQALNNEVKNNNMLNEDKVTEKLSKAEIITPTAEGVQIIAVAEVHKEPDKQTDAKNKQRDNKIENEENRSEIKLVNKITCAQDSEIAVEKCEPKKVEMKAVAKTAYSQAAAKPKVITKDLKKEVPKTTAPIARSKTASDMRVNNNNQFARKNQTNKCSYPFNLTTGRTLFENNAKLNNKKPVTRNTQMSSGDANSRINGPKRPVTLKVEEKKDDDKKAQMEKNKNSDEYGSSDTVIDMSRIESSESLKTLVGDDNHNSVEVLNLDKSDNEGWLTVKSKRFGRESKKQKSHWANRFNQPSATTSLPTLNMIESPKEENIHILNKMKPKETEGDKRPQQSEKVTPKLNEQSLQPVKPPQQPAIGTPQLKKQKGENTNSTAMLRQKSDVTGMRTRPARNKMVSKKADKAKDSTSGEDSPELKKNRLHSSLESLSTALSRSQETTEEVFDFDKWKEDYKSTSKYLQEEEHIHNEILESADPNEKNEIQEMTSQIEENERKISLALDFQNDVDQQKLCAEEDLLNRQIMELQQVSELDFGTETDDTETDAEIMNEEPNMGPSVSPILESLGPLAASLEDRYEPALAGLSWAERIDTLATLEALVARYPGRAQQLHAKLSQGMRRRGSLQETLKRYQAKQDRAEKQRLILQSERTKKIQQLLARVEEVKVAKEQLIEEKRARMDKRLQKAAQNRNQHLKDIVRKAHDEEEKLKEIAFIKQLEAEHRRQDFLLQCGTHTARLRELRRDRLNKLEQKASREAAVGARRLAIEAARRAHVDALLERRRERDARCEERKEMRRQERGDAAREKAEGVKSRLEALAAAAEQETDALRNRIQTKQDATRQRLNKHLQAIRTKANIGRPQNTSESQEVIKEATPEEVEEHLARLMDVKKRAKRIENVLIRTGIYFEDNNSPPSRPSVLNSDCTKVCRLLTNLYNSVAPFLRQIPVKLDVEEMGEKDAHDSSDENSTQKEEQAKDVKIVNGVKAASNEPQANNKPRNKKKNKNTDNKTEVKQPQNGDQNKSKNKKHNKHLDDIDEILNGIENSENNGKKNKGKKNRKNRNKNGDVSDEVEGRKNNNNMVDIAYLEKSMAELNRLADKKGVMAGHNPFTRDDRLHNEIRLKCIRSMTFLVSSFLKGPSGPCQLTRRCVTLAVTVMIRILNGCSLCATYFMDTNSSLEVVSLLLHEMESKVFNDSNMSLLMQTADCLSIGFDSVFMCSKYEEKDVAAGKVLPEEESAFLTELRSRAHNLICFMCCSETLQRMQLAGFAKEGIHTLITMCANVCKPSIFDTECRDMGSWALRTCLGPELGGARAEFCALFVGGAGLTDAGGVFVRAARTTRLLRALAELNYKIVQDAFTGGGWLLEFEASVSRLLLQHAPTDREVAANRSNRNAPERLDRKLSETMVLDLITIIGYFVIDNAEYQDVGYKCWSAVKCLCSLPASWIMSPPHNNTLMPTLVALYDHTPARSFIESELNCEMLEEYIEKAASSNNPLVKLIIQHRQKKENKNESKVE